MAEIIGLDHVGIAVRDLEESIETFSKLLGPDCEVYRIDPGFEYDDEGNVVATWRIAYLDTGNEVLLELIQPETPDQGPVGRFIDRHGEGLHHISFWVAPRSGFRAFFEELPETGFEMVGAAPWRSDPDSERDNLFTYIHPGSAHGTLIELITPYEITSEGMIPVNNGSAVEGSGN